ncbi:MAG: SLC13 family permease [Tissierellaceae bacterium]|nr:SLC13 family permease [Tissierellia bacterium]
MTNQKNTQGDSLFTKRNILIFTSLLFILFFKYIPGPEGLSQSAMQVLGIFLGVLLLWLTISIDWPSLLCLAALAFVPEINFNSMLAGSIGGSTFSFLLFTFMCTYAISQTSFIRRCAIWFITSKLAKRGPWWFLISYCASVLIIGLVMSPTVLFVIYLPILDEICHVLRLEKDDRLANGLVMGQTIACALSSGMTPIAHVFAIMAMGFYEVATGNTIGYAAYMGFAIPVGIISFVVMILIFRLFLKPDMSKFDTIDMDSLKKDIQPMEKKERLILAIFFLVIALWVVPEFIKPVLPDLADYLNGFGTAFPPLLGAVAMLIITVEGKPLLNFHDAMSKGVSWASLIMTASTLALGSAMTNADIGLTDWLTANIAPMISDLSPLILVLIFTLWAALQTNLSSNMVTITVVCAVAIPICIASDGLISTPAVASIIGMMGAYAFATPPAHPNVALASASGWTTAGQMMRYGLAIMFVTVAITVVIGYPLGVFLMGY